MKYVILFMFNLDHPPFKYHHQHKGLFSYCSLDESCVVSRSTYETNNLLPENKIPRENVEPVACCDSMMTSSTGNIFRVTGLLCWELTGNRWIPITKVSDGVLLFSLISAWANSWANNRDVCDLRPHRAYYDITVMHVIKMWKPTIALC